MVKGYSRWYFGLMLAKTILSTPLPESVTQQIQPMFRQQASLEKIQAQIVSGRHPKSFQYSARQRFQFHSQFIEPGGDRWRYRRQVLSGWLIARLRPNILDQAFIALPRELYGLYFLIRPVRLLVELFESALKHRHKA